MGVGLCGCVEKKAVYLGKRIPAFAYIRATTGRCKPKDHHMSKQNVRGKGFVRDTALGQSTGNSDGNALP